MLIKLAAPFLILLLAGCSSMRTVGELEPLNGTPLQPVRETANVVDTLLNTTGNYHTSPQASNVNRAFGHLRRINTDGDPVTTFSEIRDLERY